MDILSVSAVLAVKAHREARIVRARAPLVSISLSLKMRWLEKCARLMRRLVKQRAFMLRDDVA
jgi:hypothetical protein